MNNDETSNDGLSNQLNCSNCCDSDSENEEVNSNLCAIHNLEEEFCSSSSGCTSTFFAEEDEDLVWEDNDSSSDEEEEASTASSSSGGEGKAWRKNWTMSKILGNPQWCSKFKAKKFDTLEQFEQFKSECETMLQDVLCHHAYNTIGSFNQFHEDYKSTEKGHSFDFDDFFFHYKATLKSDALSCVGLSIRLLELFKEHFGSTISEHCGTVSCEEIIKDPNRYNMHLPNTAKEHCLLALKFTITDSNNDKRNGYLLFDPGYHVRLPIVVMSDGKYPHTGWFTTSEQPHVKRESCFNLLADRYVNWTTRETKKAKIGDRLVVKEANNLVYVKQAFGNPISIAEKRSFIFSFKSFIIRSRKGVLAGLYSYLKNNSITIFYPESPTADYSVEPIRKNVKFSVDDVGKPEMNSELMVLAKYIVEMNMHIDWPDEMRDADWSKRVDYAHNYLIEMLNSYKDAVKDRKFVNEFLEIDLWIEDEL